MEFQAESGKYTVTYGGAMLRCVADGNLIAEQKFLDADVQEIRIEDERVLFLVKYCSTYMGDNYEVVLQTFDMELHELSYEVLESARIGFFSACMDETSVYIVHSDTARIDVDDNGISRSIDAVVELTFIKIDRKTGERVEWKLNDLKRNAECTKALEQVVGSGYYVTFINSLCLLDGKLVFECDVFDPNSTVETDDPDFDEKELSDFDYVEWHSFPETIHVDLDAKTLS